jgi:hypothetical protein
VFPPQFAIAHGAQGPIRRGFSSQEPLLDDFH